MIGRWRQGGTICLGELSHHDPLEAFHSFNPDIPRFWFSLTSNPLRVSKAQSRSWCFLKTCLSGVMRCFSFFTLAVSLWRECCTQVFPLPPLSPPSSVLLYVDGFFLAAKAKIWVPHFRKLSLTNPSDLVPHYRQVLPNDEKNLAALWSKAALALRAGLYYSPIRHYINLDKVTLNHGKMRQSKATA